MTKYPQDAQSVGAIMALQAAVAQLLRESGNRSRVLGNLGFLCESLDEDALAAMKAGDMDQWEFLNEVKVGAENALAALTDISS